MSKHIPDPSVVWKHKLNDGITKLMLPVSVEVIAFDVQELDFYLWEYHKVRHNTELVERTFIIVGTGHPTPDGFVIGGYHGTVHLRSVGIVLHLFEVYDQTGNME